MIQAAVWWLIAEGLGLAALPVAACVFKYLPGRGYAFSKSIGLLLCAYLYWLGAYAGLVPNTGVGLLLVFLLVAGFSLWLALRNGLRAARSEWAAFWREHRAQILAIEILFLLAFSGWTLLRAYTPDKILPIYGEKYMEIAFLNGILNSPRFPPLDPWLSGYSISYYYFGYVMMAFITRLSGALPSVGFELFDTLLFALSLTAAFGVVSDLVRLAGGSRRASLAAGLIGSVFTGLMGNLEGAVESLYSARVLPEQFTRWLAIPGLQGAPQSGSLYPGQDPLYWWWWTASRVLNDLNLQRQPIPDPPITEFPFFSFLLGDNHPHKMALPFALLAAALALNLLYRQRAGMAQPSRLERAAFYGFNALALGALAFLNTWDFPIYLGLALAAYGLGAALCRPSALGKVLLRVLRAGLALGAGSVALYLLFYLGFSSQAGGVLPYIFPPTRLAQLGLVFGPFLFILACYLAAAAFAGRRFPLWRFGAAWLAVFALSYGIYLPVVFVLSRVASPHLLSSWGLEPSRLEYLSGGLTFAQIFQRILVDRISDPFTFLLLSALLALGITLVWQALKPAKASEGRPLSPAALFSVLLALFGLALVLSVEFFYLRDSFGLRMNTVFKFYFQGWVLMALASAFGFWWLLRQAALTKAARITFSTVAGLLVCAGLVYTVFSIASRTYSFSFPPILDAAATFAGQYPGHWSAHPDDWAAIQWLKEHASGAPTLLEAPAEDYEDAGRISAFTGFPTLLGWAGHERQWRGSLGEIDRREKDIASIFTAPDAGQTLDLLREYRVRYVIVGDAERAYVQKTCAAARPACNPDRALLTLESLLQPVFHQGSIAIYLVPEN